MWFFAKKKVYCVEWHSVWDVHRRDLVKARDEAHAWAIVRRQNPGVADYWDRIYELKDVIYR